MTKDKLEKIINDVTDNTLQLQEIIDNVVDEYTHDLDDIMLNIKREVVGIDCPALFTIEKYFLELSECLYFISDKCEKLGVYDSISRSKAQESYNIKYLEHQHINDGKVGTKKPTVAESQAEAESFSIYDRTINDMYNKAYKIVKNKVSAAETMISTLSKIYSHRMQESQMTSQQLNRRILNENAPF